MTTVDDLMKVFQCAIVDDAIAHRGNLDNLDRAGIRAVVERLRDEMTLGWEDDRPWGDVADVKKFLNEILASDGEEKAAGGSARKDETYAGAGALKVPVTASAPAAAPVCVWTRIDEDVLESGCDPDGWTYNPEIKRDTCPQCGKPISFKSEAAR